MTETRLLTLPEAQERLRVSRRTLARLTHDRRIRVIHPSPGRTLIEERELEMYVASLRRTA